MSDIRLNEHGFPIKQCPECKRDINVNSFVNDICKLCHEDSIVKIWSVTEGDYNDVYSLKTVKATGKQMDQYCFNMMLESYDKKDIDHLNTDSIGYVVYNDYNGELFAEYYIEAIIEDNFDSSVDFDLTNNNGEGSD